MSYLRYNHTLQWFDDNSTEYVFPRADNIIEDYGSNYEHLPSLVELVGHIILRETGDFDYSTKIVVALSHHLNITNKLRNTEHPHDKFEMMRRHDYNGRIKYWKTYFGDGEAKP